MFRTRQFDVSRVAWIRQRLGYAAASVKVVGLFLALEAIFDLLDYLGLVSSLLCALLVFWLGSRVAKQLRSGNGRGVVFAAVYWIAGFALGVDALTKSLRNGLNVYSVSGMLAFIVPLYFLGRGLLAFMSYMAFLRSSQDVEDPLALTPWEISPGRKRHPRFLNKKCLAAYLLVVLTPLPWLVLLIITRRSEILVSNNAVLAGIYAANALIDVGIWVWMPLIYR